MPVLTGHLTLTGTATKTVPLWRATRSGRLIRASFGQETATDGAKTATVRNATQAQDMTGALTINGLGALGHAEFAVNTDATGLFSVGDLLVLVYTVNTAGTVGPGETSAALDVSYGKQNDSGLGG